MISLIPANTNTDKYNYIAAMQCPPCLFDWPWKKLMISLMPPNANTECDLGHEWLHEWMIGRRNYHRNLVFCQSSWYLNIKVLIHFRREMLYGHYCQVYDYDVLIVSKTHIQKHKCPFLQDNKDFYVLHISYSIPYDSKLKQCTIG